MAIRIIVSNLVGFKVKGSINDASGIAQPFDFGLTCVRLSLDEIQSKLREDGESATVTDFMVSIVRDWSGVKEEDGQTVPYSEGALRALCNISGIAMLVYRAYMNEVGAKEKN